MYTVYYMSYILHSSLEEREEDRRREIARIKYTIDELEKLKADKYAERNVAHLETYYTSNDHPIEYLKLSLKKKLYWF